ncbi:MAG: RagB/SusD family nutrient uptake outer membrane protein [Ferruginibacter sp.]|nr:RagB/SusD family nutrient uptake outer membrane protein [Cytophagales bacterium]
MKRISNPNAGLLGVILLVAGACELKEEPYSFLSPDQFYQTASDAESGLTNAYANVAGLYNRVGWQLPDYSADQMFPRAVVAREQLTVFSFDATYPLVSEYWSFCYTGLNRTNVVLERVPAIQMDPVRKRQILAEAYFLRAFYHFQLVKTFGEVPLKEQSTKNIADAAVAPGSGKSTVDEIYQSIFRDLEIAERDLPAAPKDRGRAATGAASALWAKAALYHGDWARASEKAQRVLQNTAYRLIPNVVDLYDPAKEDANRTEVIFAAEFSSLPNLNASDMVAFYAPANSPPLFTKTAYGSQFGYLSFFGSFDPADKRRQLMDTAYINAAGRRIGQSDATLKDRVFVKKFLDVNSLGPNGENNYPLLRLADVLLMAAEAEAQASGPNAIAYAAINRVRSRAGLPDLSPGLGKEAFVEAVLRERSWELCFEGDRWYDLTRTGKFRTVASVTNSYYPSRPVLDKHRYFPIPNVEILTNAALQQNPLWQ